MTQNSKNHNFFELLRSQFCSKPPGFLDKQSTLEDFGYFGYAPGCAPRENENEKQAFPKNVPKCAHAHLQVNQVNTATFTQNRDTKFLDMAIQNI